MKSLAEAKAEHMRKETILTREKAAVEQTLDDAERELAAKRDELIIQENEKLSSQTELKGLRSVLDRLTVDNKKLVEALRMLSEADERAIRGLDRTDKIEHIIQEANREITVARKTIRD